MSPLVGAVQPRARATTLNTAVHARIRGGELVSPFAMRFYATAVSRSAAPGAACRTSSAAQGDRERFASLYMPDPQAMIVEALDASQLLEGNLPAVVRDINIAARVIRLLRRRRPSAVARLVVPIVVYPIDRRTVRARTHVREERREVFAPAIADSNSTAAVVAICAIGRIAASLSHRAPNTVFRRQTARRMSVGESEASRHFIDEAPATRRVSAPKMDGRRHRCPAAIASAVPCYMLPASTIRRPAVDAKTPEPLAGQFKKSHGVQYTPVQPMDAA